MQISFRLRTLQRAGATGIHIFVSLVLLYFTLIYNQLGFNWQILCLMFMVTLTLYYYYVICQDPGNVANLKIELDCPENGVDAVYFYNYCQICDIKQPVRSKHCSKCNICVRRYDHHCKFMGSCVGQLNHRDFYMYLILECITIIVAFLSSYCNFEGASSGSVGIQILWWFNTVLICAFYMVPFPLLIIQTYFLFTNRTSWEYFKGHSISYLNQLDNVNPFDLGCKGNIKQFFIMHKKKIYWNISPHKEYYQKQRKPKSRWHFLIDNKYYSCC